MTKTHTKNEPLPDAALAELDRLHAAATPGEWRPEVPAWNKHRRNCKTAISSPTGTVLNTITPKVPRDGVIGYRPPGECKIAQYISALHNAYPALRQRLLDAESRLAEAERERDELRAKNAAKEDLIREWARYVHTPTGERDTTVAERFWKDIEARFFGGEFDSLRWLTDRDAQQRREGAAEWLEKFVAIAAGLSTPVTLRILQAEANRLREGKNV